VSAVAEAPDRSSRGEPGGARKAGPLDVARAVFWSFLGIRKRAAHEKDAVTIKPVQVIVAGVIGAVIFVLSLVTLVRFITS
jgi:DUF2970 family protein